VLASARGGGETRTYQSYRVGATLDCRVRAVDPGSLGAKGITK
jgi:hypothetical protein